MGFDIFSLILHHIRLIDLLSFLLFCDPFYFYAREQTRETKTAKIKIIFVCFLAPLKVWERGWVVKREAEFK